MGKKQDKTLTPSQSVKGSNKRHLLALAIMAVSIFLAYSNSLNGTWAMDDVVANKAVSINDIHDVIGFRKIASLTFSLNRYFFPFSPASFRLFNIFLHILNASLVYLLAYKTVFSMLNKAGEQAGKKTHPAGDKADFSLTPQDKAFYAALLSGVIFALHPININAVAYIVQRMAELAAFFVLLSLLCYIYASEAKKIKALLFYAFSAVFLVMGILSKENAVVAVPLILLYDYVFLSRFNRRIFVKKALAAAAAGIIGAGAASYGMGLHRAFIEIAQFFLSPNQPLTVKGWMTSDVYWTPLQHVFTEFRVVSRYILLIFLPAPGFLVFDWWGFPISKNAIEPITTLTSMFLIFSLFLFSLRKIKRYPLLCFGILWYLFSISLESFFALGADLYFEHRNYLPVSGLFVGLAGQIVITLKGRIKKKAVWAGAAAIIVVLGSLTFTRNFIWRDSVTLWGDALKKNPSNVRAMTSIGNAYLEIPDFNKARDFYKEAMDVSIRDRRPHSLNDAAYRLGLLYLFEGDIAQAGKLMENVDKIIEPSYNIKILKGFYKAAKGDIEGAISMYNEVLPEAKGADITVVYTLMGDAYREKGLWDTAIEKYSGAIAQDQGFASAYYGIGMAYLGKRDVSLASEYLDKALLLEPNSVLALSDRAELMLITRTKTEEALVYAQRAVSKSPPFYQPYLTMGNVLLVLGREKEAEGYYKRALENNAPGYMVPLSKARAYYVKGNSDKTNYYLSELRNYKDLPEKIKDIIK